MTPEDIRDIQDEVIRAVQEGNFPQAREIISSLADLQDNQRQYRELMEEQVKANEDLQERLSQVSEPPLSCATILGPSPDDETSVLIGVGGQRLEVRVVSESGLNPSELSSGTEAWLNEDRQIVKVRPSVGSGEAALVSTVLEDGRLEVSGRGHEEVIVEPLSGLADQELKTGDRVLIDPQLGVAFEKLPTEKNQELELSEAPDISYTDIGGLDETVDEIRDVLELPYLYPRLYEEYALRRPRGILLYGPPGCGKTMLAKAIARELEIQIRQNLEELAGALALLILLRAEEPPADLLDRFNAWMEQSGRSDMNSQSAESIEELEQLLLRFLEVRGFETVDPAAELERLQDQISAGSRACFMSIKGPELLDKYVGETEHSIRRLFLQARRQASPATPVVMFFDEIEALFRRRGSRLTSDMESTIVPQFLAEIDGVEELGGNVIIIGATNRQDLLDPAILRPGRLDIKIKVSRPTQAATLAIFGKYLSENLPIQVDPSSDSLEDTLAGLRERASRLLHDPRSILRVAGPNLERNKETSFQCGEFLSGAMIENMVNRAKKRALQREIATGEKGLCWRDLQEGLREELEENKDALASSLLNVSEEELTIEVILAEGEDEKGVDFWLIPQQRPWNSGSRVWRAEA